METKRNVVELKDVAIYHTDGRSRKIKADDELVLSDVNLSVCESGVARVRCLKHSMPRCLSWREMVVSWVLI